MKRKPKKKFPKVIGRDMCIPIHIKAYKAMSNIDMSQVWQDVKGGLNLYVHVPFCEEKCTYCNLFLTTLPKTERVCYYENFDDNT